MHRIFSPLLFLVPAAALLGQTAPSPQALGSLSPLADRPDWQQLQPYSKVLTAEEFQQVYGTVYGDEHQPPVPWKADALGLSIPSGSADGSALHLDFRSAAEPPAKTPRYWRKPDELPPLKGKPVLTGLRIALDPGHIGGQWAKVEERFFTMHPEKKDEFIAEGDHVLQVAQMLKPRLEALGATVTLVRDKNEPVTDQRPANFRTQAMEALRLKGVTQPQDSYNGVAEAFKENTLQWQAEKLFYRTSEIRARGHKVNDEIKPDIVICMHLNAEPWGPEGQRQLTNANHFHVLINGSYDASETALADVRYELMHRILSRVTEEEQPLADAIAKSMASTTELPPYVYTHGSARLVGTTGYVYARNLLANRIYQCPVIYLEPYVMNNEEVYQRLLQGPYEGRTLFKGRLRTSIYDDYARGVLDGLVNYYRSKRK